MKTRCLVGVLLGVSICLLLAGGVALAQALFIDLDQDCFECNWVEGDVEPPDPPDDLSVDLKIGGWERSGPTVNFTLTTPAGPFPAGEGINPGVDEGCAGRFGVYCFDGYMHPYATFDCYPWDATEVSPRRDMNLYGDWVAELSQGDNVIQRRFRFAEVCEAEFVPEPGTIALLGSGLAGLAGYAALRWRGRS